MQAYLFAQIIVVFTYANDLPRFTTEANFWSLMWVVLAIAVGMSYFILYTVSTHLAHVSLLLPTHELPNRAVSFVLNSYF